MIVSQDVNYDAFKNSNMLIYFAPIQKAEYYRR